MFDLPEFGMPEDRTVRLDKNDTSCAETQWICLTAYCQKTHRYFHAENETPPPSPPPKDSAIKEIISNFLYYPSLVKSGLTGQAMRSALCIVCFSTSSGWSRGTESKS